MGDRHRRLPPGREQLGINTRSTTVPAELAAWGPGGLTLPLDRRSLHIS